MQVRAVQALVVVLDDQLPVGLDVVDDALAEPQVLHAPRRGTSPAAVRAASRAAAAFGVEVEEDVAVPTSACDAMQRIVRPCGSAAPRPCAARRSAGRRGRRSRRDTGTGCCRRTSPSLRCRAACRDAGRRCGTRARVRRVARDDDALAEQLADDELSGPLDLLVAPGADPHASRTAVHLALEVAAIGVVRAGSVRAACRHHLARLDDDLGSMVSNARMIQPRRCRHTQVAAPTALRRELGRWDLTAIGVNQVIGGAVFALPAALAAARRRLEPVAGRRRRRSRRC